MTVMALLRSPCGDGRLEPGHQLGPHPYAIDHRDACVLGLLLDRSKGSARSPIPYVHRGPGARPQPCGAPDSHAAPGCPPPRPIADPAPFRPARTAGSPLTAVRSPARRTSACLCRSPAWRWRTGLPRPGRVGLRQPKQPAASCVFPGSYSASARIGAHHGMYHHLRLTTVRQRGRGQRVTVRQPPQPCAGGSISRP